MITECLRTVKSSSTDSRADYAEAGNLKFIILFASLMGQTRYTSTTSFIPSGMV